MPVGTLRAMLMTATFKRAFTNWTMLTQLWCWQVQNKSIGTIGSRIQRMYFSAIRFFCQGLFWCTWVTGFTKSELFTGFILVFIHRLFRWNCRLKDKEGSFRRIRSFPRTPAFPFLYIPLQSCAAGCCRWHVSPFSCRGKMLSGLFGGFSYQS